jgi:hypothetical protein
MSMQNLKNKKFIVFKTRISNDQHASLFFVRGASSGVDCLPNVFGAVRRGKYPHNCSFTTDTTLSIVLESIFDSPYRSIACRFTKMVGVRTG